MRKSSTTSQSSAGPTGRLTDEALAGWHPDRISDRKLLELQTRLERIQRLGGTFAGVQFSGPARSRLDELASRS